MGGSSLQGIPWHYEYTKGKNNNKSCIFNIDNKCTCKTSPNYNNPCIGKLYCEEFKKNSLRRGNTNKPQNKKVSSKINYIIKKNSQSQQRSKLKKKYIKIDLIAIITIIISFATLLVTRYVDLFRKPYIAISDNIPISFVMNNEYSGYYYLNNQQMYDEIDFQGQMVALVNICNSLSNNIQLNKIYIDISNIRQDTNPYFNIYSKNKDDGVYLNISNSGWGNASDVNFTFVCSDDDISNYINKSTINIYVEEIKIGETIELPFILNKDIIDTDIYLTIDFSVYCNIGGVNQADAIKSAFLSYEIYNGTIHVPGVGGASDFVYGIGFDTYKGTFSLEEPILEEINSGEVYVIPICIFPNQTCTFDIDIKFQYLYNGKQKFINCKKKNLKVEISSSYSDDFKIDISNMNQEELNKKIQEDSSNFLEGVIFSYPFINNFVIYPKCPICYNVLHCQIKSSNILIPSKHDQIWKCDNCNTVF